MALEASVAGLTLPQFSAFDPPVSGEGSLDPMGLAAISDRLADQLVPGIRARMQRLRFVTAMAVGAVACETIADLPAYDGVSTPAVCFEWLVIESFVRRLNPGELPPGVPGSQKARAVVNRGQRLSAATYLKGPLVFGFNGVYKPFAVDAHVVGRSLEPGPACVKLTRAWEDEQGFAGFTDAGDGTPGGRLRRQIRDEVRSALREGKCTTNKSGALLGQLARSLRPDGAGGAEREALGRLITAGSPTRTELATHLVNVDDDLELTEAELLDAIRPMCSAELRTIVDAVDAYERFAAIIDAAFRTLCSVSHSMGSQPLTPDTVADHALFNVCARDLAAYYAKAADRMADVGAAGELEANLGEFAIRRTPADLFDALLGRHEEVQGRKAPRGKRPWFEPLRGGWVVRGPYGTAEQPELGRWFVHPIRVAALRRFVAESRA